MQFKQMILPGIGFNSPQSSQTCILYRLYELSIGKQSLKFVCHELERSTRRIVARVASAIQRIYLFVSCCSVPLCRIPCISAQRALRLFDLLVQTDRAESKIFFYFFFLLAISATFLLVQLSSSLFQLIRISPSGSFKIPQHLHRSENLFLSGAQM